MSVSDHVGNGINLGGRKVQCFLGGSTCSLVEIFQVTGHFDAWPVLKAMLFSHFSVRCSLSSELFLSVSGWVGESESVHGLDACGPPEG
eukprot:scaffold102631_cov18-Tisochrysis_lutea.AAC.1